MIAVDASALVAIALAEPEHPQFLAAIEQASAAVVSSINFVETGIILQRHGVVASQGEMDAWLRAHAVECIDPNLGGLALAAYLKFGKGFHPARLNLADCFAYALAKSLELPLLYKGDDFSKTDIRSAV